MLKVGENGNDLVLVTERRDERDNRFAALQVMQQLQFVLYSCRRAGHINLFDSNIFGRPSAAPARCLVQVPAVVVFVVQEIFGFVN